MEVRREQLLVWEASTGGSSLTEPPAPEALLLIRA